MITMMTSTPPKPLSAFIHVELWFTPVIPDCIIQIDYYINDNFLNKTVHENSAPRGTKIIHIR